MFGIDKHDFYFTATAGQNPDWECNGAGRAFKFSFKNRIQELEGSVMVWGCGEG